METSRSQGELWSPTSIRHMDNDFAVLDDDHGLQSSGSIKVLRRIGKLSSGIISSINTHPSLDRQEDPFRPSSRPGKLHTLPSLTIIIKFFHEVFNRSKMEHDAIAISLIYIERLVKETEGGAAPTARNWKSVLFSSMVLASKVWDDLSMWNVDFSNICRQEGRDNSLLSSFTLPRINQLERFVLNALNFNVQVTASQYAELYFRVRTMHLCQEKPSEGGDLSQSKSLVVSGRIPLDMDTAQALEVCSSKYQHEAMPKIVAGVQANRRVKSLDDLDWLTCRVPGQVDGQRHVLSLSAAIQLGTPCARLQESVCLEQVLSM